VPENNIKIVPNPTRLENARIQHPEPPQRLTTDPDYSLDNVPSEEEAVHEYMAEGGRPQLPPVGGDKMPRRWGAIMIAGWIGALVMVAVVRRMIR
jgi:hypothetical protein